jgi:hypothetical protein
MPRSRVSIEEIPAIEPGAVSIVESFLTEEVIQGAFQADAFQEDAFQVAS